LAVEIFYHCIVKYFASFSGTSTTSSPAKIRPTNSRINPSAVPPPTTAADSGAAASNADLDRGKGDDVTSGLVAAYGSKVGSKAAKGDGGGISSPDLSQIEQELLGMGIAEYEKNLSRF
jgi:hypothetical protein